MTLSREDLQAIGSLINEAVEPIKNDISKLKTEISVLKDKTAAIELTLENVTNRNIQIIAESHLDLKRKLDEACKS